MMEEKVTAKGYAKINLSLDVVDVLENGYHLLRSVMQQIDLFDSLELTKMTENDQGSSASRQILLTADSRAIPLDQTNLAYKAAKLLMEEDDIKEGVSIHISKRIPVAAGLAGGSTDAAAVLMGMNELFGLGHSKEEMRNLGVKLGADVPFCIMGGTALAEGIGEKLTPIEGAPEMFLVIAKPAIDVSTKHVYEELSLEQITHPDTEGVLAAIGRKELKAVAGLLGNVLETVTIREYPVIRKLKEAMTEEGALGALMSGSGPTVFGIFEDSESASAAERKLQLRYPKVYIRAVRTVH